MNIKEKELAKDIWLIALSGRLDQSQTIELEKILQKHLLEGKSRFLIDLSEVSYINSGGLRCLVTIWRQARDHGGELVLCGLSERLARVFTVVGFNKVFKIFPSRAEAQEGFEGV